MSAGGAFSAGGGGLWLFGAVFASDDGSSFGASFSGAGRSGGGTATGGMSGKMIAGGGAARGMKGAAAAGAGFLCEVSPSASAFGGTDPRGGCCDSRRGFGGGASLREPPGDMESLPGRETGGGMGDVRMSGRLGAAPAGRLGVPTETTGTLGILAGGGILSAIELGLSAVTSASSIVEISGFDFMSV